MEVDWGNFLIQGGATKIGAQSNLCLIRLKTFPSFTFSIIQKTFEAGLFKVTSGSVFAEVRRIWDNVHIQGVFFPLTSIPQFQYQKENRQPANRATVPVNPVKERL